MRIFILCFFIVCVPATAKARCWPFLKAKADRGFDRQELSTLAASMSGPSTATLPIEQWFTPELNVSSSPDWAFKMVREIASFKPFIRIVELVNWQTFFHGELKELKKLTWTTSTVVGRPWNIKEGDQFSLALTHAKKTETIYVSFIIGPMQPKFPLPQFKWGMNPQTVISTLHHGDQVYLIARWLKLDTDAMTYLIHRIQDRHFDSP